MLYLITTAFLIICAMAIGVIACKIKSKKFIGCALLALLFPFVFIFMIWGFSNLSGALDYYILEKREIIELDKFKNFYGKNDKGRYHSTVLIRNPPENNDSLKKIMLQYFKQKEQYLDSTDSGSYLGHVSFYEYTVRTAYFIDHDEDPGGWSSETLDDYTEMNLGFIIARNPCKNDTTKHETIMEVRNERQTLSSECNSAQVNKTFIDQRDNKTYRTVKIGEQIWMAENLNYEAEGSKCYGNKESNCAKYGRLYNWATAMALPDKCNTSACASHIKANPQGICPSGWHIPNDTEWSILINHADGTGGSKKRDSRKAGAFLKAKNDWNSYPGVPEGTDTLEFTALPGGDGKASGGFEHIGYSGSWWSASEENATGAYSREMRCYNGEADSHYYTKVNLRSVRCIKD